MGGPTDTPRSEAGGRPHLGSQGKCSGQRPQATPPLLSCPSRPLTQAKASARLCKETPTSKALQLFSGTWPPSPEAPQLSVPGVMAGASQAGHGAEPGTCDHLSPGIRDSDLKSCVLFSLIQFTCDNRYKDCSTFSSFPPSPPCTNPKGWGGKTGQQVTGVCNWGRGATRQVHSCPWAPCGQFWQSLPSELRCSSPQSAA